MPFRPRRLPLAILIATATAPVYAADPAARWGQCPASPASPELPAATDAVTRLSADQVTADQQGLATFIGDVVVQQAGKRASGAEAQYRREQNTLEISGDVKLDTRDFAAEGRTAHIDLGSDSGRIEQASYRVPSVHASGEADRVELLGQGHAVLHRATYTTCPQPDPDWNLKARRVELTDAENTGEAWDAQLEFKGVPFLYMPYFNFPLAGRKSGFLVPTYGQSAQSGTDLRVPYYLNLAPDRDATLSPRWLSERGFMLESEYRYLGATGGGQVNLDFLADDRKYGADRYFVAIDEKRRPAERWSTELHYRQVSDSAYFNDLDNRLESSSLVALDRRFDVRYGGDDWSFLGRVQALQNLGGFESYRRMPQLRLDYHDPSGPGRLQFGLGSELVHFTHEEAGHVEGSRFDLEPSVSLPLRDAAWFVTPRLAVRHTQYQLEQTAAETAPTRTLPIASLDAGAFFDRDFSYDGHPFVQTLEPRLYYLNVPYRNQSAIPVFDTARLDLTLDQLFRENRYSGADRVGDANQLSLAATSRILNGTDGAELGFLSLGQIRYFENRRVTLPDETAEETAGSAYLASVGLKPARGLDVGGVVRWDPERTEHAMVTAYTSYNPDPDRRVVVSYRYREKELEQAGVLGVWPLSRDWRLLGLWNYDLRAKQPLETIAGLEYQSCCWAVRLVSRSRLNSSTEKLDHSLLLSLELKGLSTLGNGPGQELERGILR